MLRKFFINFLLFSAFAFCAFLFIFVGMLLSKNQEDSSYVLKEKSVLVLSLKGIILDDELINRFLLDLRKYSKKDEVKGILVLVNSPGGTVGKSQEIYLALKRIKETLEKPVVALCQDIAASGGYYSILAADHILTHPGTLMGSIGVVAHFVNLEELYRWIRVKAYAIKSGEFKDAGSHLRPMTEREKDFFERLLGRVHLQFKTAVGENRKSLLKDILEEYTDGRVFTGESAVKLGFADQVGTYEDALEIVESLTGFKDLNVFLPPPEKKSFLESLFEVSVFQMYKFFLTSSFPTSSFPASEWSKFLFTYQNQLLRKPLYLMPNIQ